jgi:hypothetical protein
MCLANYLATAMPILSALRLRSNSYFPLVKKQFHRNLLSRRLPDHVPRYQKVSILNADYNAIAETTATPSSSNIDATTQGGLWITQQPWITGRADAPIPAAQPTQTQLDNEMPMSVDAENQSMAIADEEMQAHLRDEGNAQAAAGSDVQRDQQARDERRTSEIARDERASEIGPSSEAEKSGVIFLPGRDAVPQQALDESAPESANQSPLSVLPNEELVHSAASYVLSLDTEKNALCLMTRDLNQMIKDDSLSSDEVFRRWLRSSLAKTYNEVGINHLCAICASRR